MNYYATMAAATLANMRKHYREGIFAWSPITGEEYSADPRDYFMLTDDVVLRDDTGEPMVLASRSDRITVVSAS